jgi:SH3 domain protein
LKSALLTLAIILAVFTGVAHAEQRYVTDNLGITLRSGQDSSYRVLRELKSGTSVEVLSENKETGYSRVRTADGTEGYALTRFLTAQTPAKTRITELQKELEQLRDQPEGLQEKLTELQGEYQSLKLRYDSLEFENVQLTQRMEKIRDNASNVVSLLAERDKAIQRANNLSTELEELRVKTRELQNHSDKKWFMAGAGVLVLGVIIGIILPRVSGRRRKGWGGSGDISL